MNYVYINKTTNIVESVVTTDLAYDKNSNLQETQYCVEQEELQLNLSEYKYRYINGVFEVYELIVVEKSLSVDERLSAMEDVLLNLLGV